MLPILQSQLINTTVTDTLKQAQAPADSLVSLKEVSRAVISGNGDSLDYHYIISSWLSNVINFGIRVVIAILVFFLCRWVMRRFVRWFRKRSIRHEANPGLTTFLVSLFNVLFVIAALIISINILGFESVSFAALLASMGIAIGAALSGQLQNLAAGVIILLTKPFKVGDWIEAEGEEGTVENITIFYTSLRSVSNSTVYIPNAKLTSNKLVNSTEPTTRRCQWIVGVTYGSDLEQVKKVMRAQVENDARVDTKQPILLVCREFADSSVKVMMRAWTSNNDYWDLYWEVNERLYNAFNKEGIQFAFPTVTLYNTEVPTYHEDTNISKNKDANSIG